MQDRLTGQEDAKGAGQTHMTRRMQKVLLGYFLFYKPCARPTAGRSSGAV